ncbi:hypothetical protein JCM10908_005881 [Rhodotorula pacifica]|uniref:uncharacterized protein n=1 Tax=Rhodotorula pacifica TaxID=1495444 RepID=UPI00317E10C8
MANLLPELVTPPAAAMALEQAQSQGTSSLRRKILTQDDMQHWIRSEAYTNIERFIVRLRAASTRQIETEGGGSELVKRFNALLKESTEWLDGSASPSSTSKAFKAWLTRLEQAADKLYHESLTPAQHIAIPELAFHLRSSFGSPTRLDYGTGHELSFLSFLLILRLVGAFTAEDEPALARETFAQYLEVMKLVQKVFRLEAAGKMGIWGLDEHQHLVYHWGASQTRIHPSKRPALLVAPPGSAGISYLFLSSLLHLHGDPVPAATATSPSPSSSNSDDQDFQGLLRLYKHEVLDRLPVVQHFQFGPILRWVAADSEASLPLPSTGDSLTDDELEALDATLDRRVTADGTVAPWALPSLSGTATPDEILERLPSPVASRTSSPAGKEVGLAPPELASELSGTKRSGSVSPRARTSPLPYPSPTSIGAGTDTPAWATGSPTRAPMQRRMSRLSICEMSGANDGGGDEEQSESEAKEALREAVKSGNKELVSEGDESTFDFV